MKKTFTNEINVFSDIVKRKREAFKNEQKKRRNWDSPCGTSIDTFMTNNKADRASYHGGDLDR